MKKKKHIDLNNIDEIIKMLNNKKTTIEDVLSRLQDLIEEFQHNKEDFYINDLKEQIEETETEVENEALERWAEKIQKLVMKDTKHFVDSYIKRTNDNILDAINENKVKKDPAHAFLILLQTMEKAFKKTEDQE